MSSHIKPIEFTIYSSWLDLGRSVGSGPFWFMTLFGLELDRHRVSSSREFARSWILCFEGYAHVPDFTDYKGKQMGSKPHRPSLEVGQGQHI